MWSTFIRQCSQEGLPTTFSIEQPRGSHAFRHPDLAALIDSGLLVVVADFRAVERTGAGPGEPGKPLMDLGSLQDSVWGWGAQEVVFPREPSGTFCLGGFVQNTSPGRWWGSLR